MNGVVDEIYYGPQTPVTTDTAPKMKFTSKDFFIKCDRIRRKLWIWSNLFKKSLMENFIFGAARSV